MAKGRARQPNNVVCPGCERNFSYSCNLKRHLGAKRYALHEQGVLKADACVRNTNCITQAKRRFRQGARVVVCASGGIFVASLQPGAVSKTIPADLLDVCAIEGAGIPEESMTLCADKIERVPCIRKYVQDETPLEKRNLLRLLTMTVYSMHAMLVFNAKGLSLSGTSLALGIGRSGMDMLGDATCYRSLYTSLSYAFDSPKDRILWMVVAHSIARPSLIQALHNMVCARRMPPTRANVSKIAGALARLHGFTPSRMLKGKRCWRRIDAYGNQSTNPLSSAYCGSAVLHKQIKTFGKLVAVAEDLAVYSAKDVYFSTIVQSIGKQNLTGYARKGYWTVHLARVLDPAFAGVSFYRKVKYRESCAKTIYQMGGGAKAMKCIGIGQDEAFHKMEKLCQCIETLASWYGYSASVTRNHQACLVCEAHRRNVFGGAGGVNRRPGL